jgi:antirestriction protein
MELPKQSEVSNESQTGIEEQRIVPPRIYVASLSDYNAGRLHGEWIDAEMDIEDLENAVTRMLASSPEPLAEEWAIHDYEGFGPVRLSEYESLPTVNSIAKGIVEHGPAFAAWAAIVDDMDQLDRFEDAYLGHWSSLTEYAEQLLDDMGIEDELDRVVPEGFRAYVQIDAEMLGRDLGMDLSVMEDGDGSVHLFDQQV